MYSRIENARNDAPNLIVHTKQEFIQKHDYQDTLDILENLERELFEEINDYQVRTQLFAGWRKYGSVTNNWRFNLKEIFAQEETKFQHPA